MSPISSSSLVRRQDTEDSPLSITANVIAIVTFVFAVIVATQVYLRLLKNAKEDLSSFFYDLSATLVESRRVLCKIDSLQDQFYHVVEANYPLMNLQIATIHISLADAREGLHELIRRVELRGSLFDHWPNSWRLQAYFRAEEQELNKEHEELIRQTANCRALISEAENM